jgi:hypothetical protein
LFCVPPEGNANHSIVTFLRLPVPTGLRSHAAASIPRSLNVTPRTIPGFIRRYYFSRSLKDVRAFHVFLVPAEAGANVRRVHSWATGRSTGCHVKNPQRSSITDWSQRTDVLETIISISPNPIIVLDTEGNVVLWNPASERLFGWSADEVLGKPHPIVPPEYRAAFQERHRRALDGDVMRDAEARALCKDGSTKLVTRSTEILRDEKGRPIGAMGVFTDLTERRHVEEQLRLQASALRSVSEGVAMTDVDERIIYVNEAFQRMYGYREDELLGQPIEMLRAPAQEHITPLILSGTLGGGWRGEILNRRKDGSFFPIALSTSIVVDDQGDPIAHMGVAVDITKRRAAEEALRRSDESYRGLFNAVGDAIYVQDRTGRFVDVNRGAEEMYGYGRGDFIGRTPEFLSASSKNDLAATIQAVERTFAGTPQRFEWWGRRKNGEEFPKDVRLFPGTYFGQEVVIALARDITEQKRTEVALRDSEERYRLLFETNPRPMWVYDLGTLAFLAVNDAAVRHYGYTREDFLAMTILDIRPPEDVGRLLENIAHVTEGIDEAGVWRHRRKDGSVIDVEITSHTLTFGGHQAELVMSVDVTEKHDLQRQLMQSQKLESIGTLASGIAHDINNILTIILGYASLLPTHRLERDRFQKDVDVIIDSVRRGAGLVQQILMFARKTESHIEAVDANRVVDDLGRVLQETFPRTIAIQMELADGLPMITMDPNHLHQALLNLCVNARDAMPAGGTLTLSTAVVDGALVARRFGRVQDERYLRLSVGDTGEGMTEKVRHRIFDPFFTTKEKGKGTGLGLAVVFGIVESHHGFVDVHSEPGAGSAFTLYFPASKPGATTERAVEASTVPSPAHGQVLLFVEDEQELSDLVVEYLQSEGYHVLTAHDGLEALRLFEERRREIAVVVSDIGLPGLDGWSVFRRMREMHPGVRCVLASGYLEPEVWSSMREEGISGFLQKPYELEALTAAIRGALPATADKK